MAKEKSSTTDISAVGVIFDPQDLSTHIHWGISFKCSGDKGSERLLATVPNELAEQMIDSGRAVKA